MGLAQSIRNAYENRGRDELDRCLARVEALEAQAKAAEPADPLAAAAALAYSAAPGGHLEKIRAAAVAAVRHASREGIIL